MNLHNITLYIEQMDFVHRILFDVHHDSRDSTIFYKEKKEICISVFNGFGKVPEDENLTY